MSQGTGQPSAGCDTIRGRRRLPPGEEWVAGTLRQMLTANEALATRHGFWGQPGSPSPCTGTS